MQLAKRISALALALALAILSAVPMTAHAETNNNIVYVDGLPESYAIIKGATNKFTLDFPASSEAYFYMVVYSAQPLTITTGAGTGSQIWSSGSYRCYKVPMYQLAGTREISITHSADFDLSVYFLSTFRYARHGTLKITYSKLYYTASSDPTAITASSGTAFTGFPQTITASSLYTNVYIPASALVGLTEISIPIRMSPGTTHTHITDIAVYSGGYPVEATFATLETADQIYAAFDGLTEMGDLESGQQYAVLSFKPTSGDLYCVQIRCNVGSQGGSLQVYQPVGFISSTPDENFIFHEILRHQELTNDLLAELLVAMQGDSQASQDFGTDAQNKSNNLQSQVNQMGQLEKPDISHVDMSFNAHVTPSTLVTNVAPLTAMLSNSKLVSMVLMATIIALVSYVLFGRK